MHPLNGETRSHGEPEYRTRMAFWLQKQGETNGFRSTRQSGHSLSFRRHLTTSSGSAWSTKKFVSRLEIFPSVTFGLKRLPCSLASLISDRRHFRDIIPVIADERELDVFDSAYQTSFNRWRLLPAAYLPLIWIRSSSTRTRQPTGSMPRS